MASSDEILERVERAMTRPLQLPHQAAAVAIDLFRLGARGDDPHIATLSERFRARLRDAGLHDVLDEQLRYAIRLASDGGALAYEEMHKLFSLCDAIHAMQWLGLSPSSGLAEVLETSARDRFARQPRDAGLVAEDRAEDWNRSLWWYAERRTTR
jgi:hypothetical protein